MRIVTILISTFLILSPIVVSAEVPNQALLLQIEALREQIHDIQVKLDLLKKNSTNAVIISVAVQIKQEYLNRTLKLGSEGDDVMYLQKFLSKDADIYPEKLVTGYYGGLTTKAVKRYQEREGLESVGSVGPLTRAKINGAYTKDDLSLNKVVENKDSDAVSIYAKNGVVYWETDTKKVKKGVVLVWSKDERPTYPAREHDIWAYYENSLNGSHEPLPRAGSGLYYARMCAFDFYTNECDIYSNQIEVEL